jgi:type IV pilus assembly protein PilC
MLRIPVLGMMMKKVAVARFTRTLGTLISSGVPILQALEVTAETAGNLIIADAVHKTRVSIKEGESIADPLRQSAVFPPMVVQMIAVGEETGELKALTSVIEPVIIVFMGLVIGGIVMAIFLPMLKLVNMGS